MKPWHWIPVIGALTVIALLGTRSSLSQTRTDMKRFEPCPNKPNCVSTRVPSGDSHFIEPIRYEKPLPEAVATLKAELSEMPRVKPITEDGTYLHFEFRSLLFRFVDDVEFEFDEDTKTLHFRSASRVGHSDLGVNRERIENIRRRLQNKI